MNSRTILRQIEGLEAQQQRVKRGHPIFALPASVRNLSDAELNARLRPGLLADPRYQGRIAHVEALLAAEDGPLGRELAEWLREGLQVA